MNEQLHCKHKGCGFSTNKPTAYQRQQSLKMHVARAHEGMKAGGVGNLKKKAKKQTNETTIAVNFCPCCGVDLHKIALAMVVAERMLVK